jgi:ATP-dependent Zn protease
MENGSVLAALLYNWAPILLMIGFWLWIMRRVGGTKQRNYTERSIAFMDRQEQLLERIATALEQRNKHQS